MIHVDTPHGDTHTYQADSYSVDSDGTLHVLNHQKDVASHPQGSWERVHLPDNEKPEDESSTTVRDWNWDVVDAVKTVHDDGGQLPGGQAIHIKTNTADYYIKDQVVEMIERLGDKATAKQVMDGRT